MAACASQRALMNGLAASRPRATTSSVGAVAPPATSSMVFSVASASTIMIATSPSGSTRPATTMSKAASSSSLCVGKATHWPRISATRVPPTGPENGRPDSWVDADAPLMARTSYRWSGSSASTVMTTWTSLRRPLAKVGRSGRSMSRQVRIASSDGRPSRRKNEPGILPIAYIRSSTSTVSGKKSNWSLGWRPAVVADSSVVSPMVATTEPAACLARRPVSKVTVREPRAPLASSAVAVNTPSSASKSVSVVGADIVSSSYVAYGDVLFAAACADGVRGDRSSIEALGGVAGSCVQARCVPGATTEDRPLSRESVGAVRRWSRAAGAARARGPSRCSRSGPRIVRAARAEPRDERAVPVDVGLRQVVQQPPAAADQQEQAPPAVVVVLVQLEVLGEVADPSGQHRGLHLRGTGVALDRRVLGHDLLLRCALQRHGASRAGHVWPPVCVTGAACTHVGPPTSWPRLHKCSSGPAGVPRGGGGG